MAELRVSWESVERVSREKKAVVTGESAADVGAESESDAPVSPLLWANKPIVVYVCDEFSGCEGFDTIEKVILKDEKVALGMRVFKRVKMHPDDVEADEFLAGKGKEVPRMLFIEPNSLKVQVLEKSNLKTSKYRKAMQKTSDKFYKEKLKTVVAKHLDLLFAQDKVSNATDVVKGKIERLSKGKVKESKLESARKDLAELAKEWDEVKKKLRDNWKLTPKQA